MKTCYKCKVEKPREQFSKDASRKDGLQPRCNACNVVRNAALYAEHKEKIKAYNAGHRMTHSLEYLLYRAKARAKKKGLLFNLTVADFPNPPTYCHYFGMKLLYGGGRGKREADSASIDRIDSALGYVKGNVEIISWKANSLKKNGTEAEHRIIADYLRVFG